MTVDTIALRRTHVDGWRPRQSVTLDVETLRALLDEVDALRQLTGKVDDLTHACERLVFMNRELVAAIDRLSVKLDEGKAGA